MTGHGWVDIASSLRAPHGVSFALVFLAGPQVRPSRHFRVRHVTPCDKRRESTAGLVRESYLSRKQISVKRVCRECAIPDIASRPATITDWMYMILACAVVRRSKRPECHHPKCARPKEFSVVVSEVSLRFKFQCRSNETGCLVEGAEIVGPTQGSRATDLLALLLFALQPILICLHNEFSKSSSSGHRETSVSRL